MAISACDLFTIGIGPSSSHTVGPMRAAKRFAASLQRAGMLNAVSRVKAEMYGSLGATGRGHGTPKAVMLGLEGEDPETVDVLRMSDRVAAMQETKTLCLDGTRRIPFNESIDLILHRRKNLPHHPNGMIYTAYDRNGDELASRTYYSVGGGFVVDESASGSDAIVEDSRVLTYPFKSCAELLAHCERSELSISDIMLQNETAWRSATKTRIALLRIWKVMRECVHNGCRNEGELPGGLKVKRRAPALYRQLHTKAPARASDTSSTDPLFVLDWVTLYALAVNEENAAGARVVTAPTNGAAGIIPAVIHYYMRFVPGSSEAGVVRFLLTAAAIGTLYKENASISGADVGCQGEVGSACSMAAGALAEVMGGTPQQVENAAEIGMEHNLGLTCDPIAGLVQIPCIERNAVASIKAISAARIALNGDGSHFVSLDKVIKTMRATGRDMKDKYKETARGGLAVNVIEC